MGSAGVHEPFTSWGKNFVNVMLPCEVTFGMGFFKVTSRFLFIQCTGAIFLALQSRFKWKACVVLTLVIHYGTGRTALTDDVLGSVSLFLYLLVSWVGCGFCLLLFLDFSIYLFTMKMQ